MADLFMFTRVYSYTRIYFNILLKVNLGVNDRYVYTCLAIRIFFKYNIC